jgi:hypothetical protein
LQRYTLLSHPPSPHAATTHTRTCTQQHLTHLCIMPALGPQYIPAVHALCGAGAVRCPYALFIGTCCQLVAVVEGKHDRPALHPSGPCVCACVSSYNSDVCRPASSTACSGGAQGHDGDIANLAPPTCMSPTGYTATNDTTNTDNNSSDGSTAPGTKPSAVSMVHALSCTAAASCSLRM